jgi:hypothetical protein
VAKAGIWRILSAGDNPSGIALAVDFDVTGRVEARFSDLVANLDTSCAIWEAVPPPADETRTGVDYVSHWARGAADAGLPVHALLGFCAGSVYAAALAEHIGQAQGTTPLLLLFDPELSMPRTLLWQFLKIVGFMSGTIPPEAAAAMRDAGQRAFQENPKIEDLRKALSGLVREQAEPAFERAGLDRRLRGELLDIIDSCLSYLAAASDIDPLEQWKSAIAFCSSSPMSGLRGMKMAGHEVSVARDISVAADHGTLLADKQIAATVSRLLNGQTLNG